MFVDRQRDPARSSFLSIYERLFASPLAPLPDRVPRPDCPSFAMPDRPFAVPPALPSGDPAPTRCPSPPPVRPGFEGRPVAVPQEQFQTFQDRLCFSSQCGSRSVSTGFCFDGSCPFSRSCYWAGGTDASPTSLPGRCSAPRTWLLRLLYLTKDSPPSGRGVTPAALPT